MKRAYIVVIVTVLVALIAAIGVRQLPVPSSWQYTGLDFYLLLVGNSVMMCLHIGAAILFATSLGVYKAKLHRVYMALAAGIVVMAFGTLQVAIVTALDAWQSVWVQRGGVVMPFLLSSLMLYLGMQYLARLIGVKHILTRVWLVLPVVFVISALSFPLPHVTTTIPEIGYDIALSVTVWATCLSLAASTLIYRIRQHVGAHYWRTMTLLMGAIMSGSVLLVAHTIYTIISTDITHVLERIVNILAVVSGVLWLGAGYTFARAREYGVVSVGKLAQGARKEGGSGTALDIVMYAANLVSNTHDVDPLLDQVRVITSKLKPGEELSDKDTKLLIETYFKIEHYLITKERIRVFTQEGLRNGLDENLQRLLKTYESSEPGR